MIAIEKIWGTTEPLVMTPMFEMHRLTIKPGSYSWPEQWTSETFLVKNLDKPCRKSPASLQT